MSRSTLHVLSNLKRGKHFNCEGKQINANFFSSKNVSRMPESRKTKPERKETNNDLLFGFLPAHFAVPIPNVCSLCTLRVTTGKFGQYGGHYLRPSSVPVTSKAYIKEHNTYIWWTHKYRTSSLVSDTLSLCTVKYKLKDSRYKQTFLLLLKKIPIFTFL